MARKTKKIKAPWRCPSCDKNCYYCSKMKEMGTQTDPHLHTPPEVISRHSVLQHFDASSEGSCPIVKLQGRQKIKSLNISDDRYIELETCGRSSKHVANPTSKYTDKAQSIANYDLVSNSPVRISEYDQTPNKEHQVSNVEVGVALGETMKGRKKQRMQNPDLTWESSSNTGFDAGLDSEPGDVTKGSYADVANVDSGDDAITEFSAEDNAFSDHEHMNTDMNTMVDNIIDKFGHDEKDISQIFERQSSPNTSHDTSEETILGSGNYFDSNSTQSHSIDNPSGQTGIFEKALAEMSPIYPVNEASKPDKAVGIQSERKTVTKKPNVIEVSHSYQLAYACTECPKRFRLKKYLTRHMRIHNGATPYQCPYCPKAFSDHSSIRRHKRTHTGEKPYECKFCAQRFGDSSGRNKHQKMVHGKSFRCRFCAKILFDAEALKKHEELHNGVKRFNCQYCGKEFSDKGSLDRHERIHTGETPYQCPICLRRFNDLANRNRHMKTKHYDETNLYHGETNLQNKKISYERNETSSVHFDIEYQPSTCTSLDSSHGDQEKLDKPLEVISPVDQVFEKNKTVTHTKSEAKEHEVRHINQSVYTCTKCPKWFRLKTYLTRHMRIHDGVKPYQCPYCPKAFSDHSSIIRHKRTHTGEKPYECKFCAQRFGDSSSRNIHQKKVHGKSFRCRFCAKVHFDEEALIKHEELHNGVKKFNCQYCGKGFSHKTSLDRHERTHTGETPYQCIICSQKFHDPGNYYRHIKFKHSDKKFECPVCFMQFKVKQSLTRHARQHTGEKPFQCTLCHKRFACNTAHKRHVRRHTPAKDFHCRYCKLVFLNQKFLDEHLETYYHETLPSQIDCDATKN